MTKLTFSLIGKCILLSALSCVLQSCSAQYSAESITGWVVDADTGRPLEGVNVTANWRVEEGNLAGTNGGGDIQIMETVTDQTGRYQFPAWGPKRLPPKKNGWWVDQYIGNGDPELVFFKRAYRLESRSNVLVMEHNRSLLRRSDWNGKTIKLKSLGASAEENIDNLWRAAGALSFALHADRCEWQKIPRMLAAQLKENEKFTKPNNFIVMLTIYSIPTDLQCASPQEFLKEYLK
ncbi:MAG: carboxypeptidase-like regulatory domain-containing protein [Pseudomonadota bacterium]